MLNLYNFKIIIILIFIMISGRWKYRYIEILERVYFKEDICILFYSSLVLN